MSSSNFRMEAKNLYGRCFFFRLAARMLIMPRTSYRIVDEFNQYNVEIPGAKISDVLKCLKFGVSHLWYGVTFIKGSRVLLPSEWEELR